MNNSFPRMVRVRQRFPQLPPLDIRATVAAEFAKVRSRIKPGARIAVAVGSRGITNLPAIISSVVAELRNSGAESFIIPAMGSHGGATPEGQRELLEGYGISEATMGVPIRASMEVRQIGTSEDGAPVLCSVEALGADGIVIVNRVKPHTDFGGPLGSGVVKMSVIGLGKHAGAAAMHAAASRIGYERAIRGIARVVLRTAPVLCGVAIVENQFHDTARIAVLPREDIETLEEHLLVEARKLMPLLPFDEIDLLVIDRIGKNISGAGMDPNVTGRWVQGYSSSLVREGQTSPFVRRIFVRDLTPETHGNAIGIGSADVTTGRLVRGMDHRATFVNALTALTPHGAKIPMWFDTDHEAIDASLKMLALSDVAKARVVRITDTLSLANLDISEPLLEEARQNPKLEITGNSQEMRFDATGNLVSM